MNDDEIVVRNEAGDLEIINVHTGEVVKNSNGTHDLEAYKFDYHKAMRICTLVREGKTLAEISQIGGMPPLEVIAHWQRKDRMFAEEMKIARKERGEHFFDRAMMIANNAAEGLIHKEDVPAATLASNLYRWGAERSKPESYGNKVTHEGNAEKPILMRVINTGINRQKPDVVVAKTEEIIHVEEK